MGLFDSLYSADGNGASDPSLGNTSGFDAGWSSGYNLSDNNAAPVDSGSNSLWSAITNGISTLGQAATTAAGVYQNVQNPQGAAGGAPEQTPDGRYVANIQGTPTVLQTDTSKQWKDLAMFAVLGVAGYVALKHL